jgi:hypothetical protein
MGAAPAIFSDLGPLRHHAKASTIGAWIAFALGVAILLAWTVLSTLLALDQLRQGREPSSLVVPLVMLFLFFVPIGGIFARKGWTGRLYELELHDHGVAYRSHAGRIEIRWSELSSVFWEELQHKAGLGFGLDVPTHRTAKLSLVPMRGTTIVIDDKLPDHVALAALVRDAAAEAMLPRYEAALAAGQRAVFGSIAFDAYGLHTPRLMVPWETVAFVRWEQSGPSAWYAVYNAHGQAITTFDTKTLPNQIIFEVLLTKFGKLGRPLHERSFGATIAGAVERLLAA